MAGVNLRPGKGHKINISGHRFGTLLAMFPVKRPAGRKTAGLHWMCFCLCGDVSVRIGGNLRAGRCSCSKCRGTGGPLQPANTKTFSSWRGMRERCTNPNHASWPNYGGRGITFCQAWDDYQTFYRDMGPKPHGHSLDRIDCDGDYCPENCRWLPVRLQSRNTRQNKLDESKAREIRERARAGEIGVRLAEEFSVSSTVVYGIRDGKLWSD